MNLLKANWYGKVGQTVGAKWKDKSTIRTYAKPSNPDTQAQRTIRAGFKDITSYAALFSDQIKYLTSLDTRSMSVRNAIIKANKEQIEAGVMTVADLVVNKGGLPNVNNFALGAATAGSDLTATFVKPAATNITDAAIIVVVAVDAEEKVAVAAKADLDEGTITIPLKPIAGQKVDVFYWVIDYRGSARVGSNNGYTTVTA